MDDSTLQRVIQAINAAGDDGSPVAAQAEETAKFAMRRYRSQSRRKVKDDRKAKVQDLSKGIIEHFDDPQLVGPLKVDYLHLAGIILDVLEPAPTG